MSNSFDVSRGRLAWWLFGLTLGLLVLYVVYRFIGTFVFGVFLYYATRPVFKRVRPRVGQRSIAAALSLTLLVLPALLLVGYTIAIAYMEFQNFASLAGEWADEVELGDYEALLDTYVEASEAVANPQELLAGNGMEVLGGVVLTSVGYLGTLGLFALHLFVIVAIAFYLLRDDHKLSSWIRTRFGDEAGVLEEFLSVVDNDFNNIFFGNILNAVMTGTIGAIVYTLLNLGAPAGVSIPYAALVGLLTGVASLIPVVGMKIVYVPVGIYVLALPFVNQQPEALWFSITFLAVSFVVVDTIPDLVLRPYVSGRSLHMGALMLAYVLGPLLFGWYGLFLAPMMLVLVVHFGRVVLPELVDGSPLQPYAVDPATLSDDDAGGAAPAPVAPGDEEPGHSRANDGVAKPSADEPKSDVGEPDAGAGDGETGTGKQEGGADGDGMAASGRPPEDTGGGTDDRNDVGDGTDGRGDPDDGGDPRDEADGESGASGEESTEGQN